ncbi:MAG: ATP-binding protein, partial [Proteobacteria bacterium]|nr:ATP-binding protein [Pseudomonadota bacterium]
YALRNLIDNAIKFCSSLVKIEILNSNRKIYINIFDDGKGFPQDIVRNLGDPYIRSSLISKSKSGLGLGIFISKTLLERTGAKVNFKQNIELGGALISIVWKESDLVSN